MPKMQSCKKKEEKNCLFQNYKLSMHFCTALSASFLSTAVSPMRINTKRVEKVLEVKVSIDLLIFQILSFEMQQNYGILKV